jgi:hypothetical protein
MNMDLKLNFKPEDLRKVLPVLRVLQPYVVGLLLIGVFGYTAYVVNGVLNVQPGKPAASSKDAPAISFDQKTIDTLKQLQVVTGDVPTGNLGQSNPF